MCFTSMFLNVLRSTSLAAFILLSSVSVARSDQWMVQNGEVLLASCVSNDSWAGSCMGFVTAIASVISENQIYGLRACIPREATPRNLIAVAIEWLSSQSPEGRQSDAASLVAEAISRRFPCAKEKSP
jgi:Rap1a immunity proteins